MRFWNILLLACLSGPVSAAPNILFIMTDDHAVPALSAYGGKLNSTPHLDGLAGERSQRFEDWTFGDACWRR